MSDRDKQKKADYLNLRRLLLGELDRIAGQENCDIHAAFVTETAKVMSSIGPGYVQTDGANEWGIDFCRDDAPVFTACQCKCPERSTLEAQDKPVKYDRDAFEDVLTAINFLVDGQGTYPKAVLDVKTFKNAYHESIREWPKETKLQVALAVFGELTGEAKNYFEQQRNVNRAKGIELLLWDWRKFDDLLATPQVDVGKMRIHLTVTDPKTEILRLSSTSVLCFAHGYDLVQAWEEYQWTLVDWNVRAEILNSPTNEQIKNTLLSQSRRRHFHDYNNGLLVVCTSINYPKEKPRNNEEMVVVRLQQPQVVNGCQTLLSLVRAYMDLNEEDKADFRKNVRVLVKIISSAPQQLVDAIILSTNDQNPMSRRSLKANTPEQKKLQQGFGSNFVKYFYERKDGQFEGFLNFPKGAHSFRPSEYQITSGKKKYRKLDNQELALEWLAFIGLCDRTLRAKVFDEDTLYKTAFLLHPNKNYWRALKTSPAARPPVDDQSCFDEGSPSPGQYLLAHLAGVVIQKRKVSFQKSRKLALERLARRGKIKVDAAGEPIDDVFTVDQELMKDDEYTLNNVINNMQSVLIELMAMLLQQRYGALDDAVCERFLRWPCMRRLLEDPYAEIPEDAGKIENRHILNLCYEFLLFAIGQYAIKYNDVLRTKPQLRSYLANRDTIDALRAFVLLVNDEKTPRWAAAWCPDPRPFLDQLPDICDR